MLAEFWYCWLSKIYAKTNDKNIWKIFKGTATYG